MGRLSPLQIAPGIVKTQAPYALKGRWIDCDKMRFRPEPEKWAGYELSAGPVTGIPRKMIAWDDFSVNRWLAVGTHSKLQIIKADTSIINATPFRDTGTLTNPFDVTNTSAIVTVHDTSHLLSEGDTVLFDGADVVGGITIDGEYLVDSVVDTDTYTVIHSAPATSSVSGGGGTVDFFYEIAPGSPNVVTGNGYGTGRYGRGTYGTPRTGLSLATRYPRMWSFALAGENLFAMPSGQQIYQWDPDSPTDRAVAITNSPTGFWMFMTNERLPVVLGVDGDLMTIAWPDINDYTDWTPALGSTATVRALAYGNRMVAGTNLRTFTNLLWSDTHCYLMQFTGASSVYSTLPVGAGCGLIGPNAFAVDGSGNAYWMSTFSLYMYSGGVQEIPNVEDIKEWLFKRLHDKQRWKVNAYFSSKHNEVRWHYIHIDDVEAQFYVAVGLGDFSWTNGTYERNAMAEQAGTDATVYGIDNSGYVYREETGSDANGEAMPAFIESAPIDIDDGNQLIDIQGVVPNFERQVGPIELTLTSWDKPQDADELESQNHTIEEGQGIVDCYMSGRQVSFRLDTIALGGDMRIGKFRVEVVDESPAKRR